MEGLPRGEEEAMTLLFCQHVLPSLEKQQRFVLERLDARWDVDLDGGTLTFKRGLIFGKKERFRLQIIALEEPARGSWRWAWDLDDVPATLARGAEVLRQRGARDGLSFFTTAEIPAPTTEEALSYALIAVGLLRSHFYWCVDTERGNAWTVVNDASYQMPHHPPFERFCAMVRDTIGNVFLPEHRAPLVAFAEWLGLDSAVGRDGSLVVGDAVGRVTLGFDAFTRVTSMDVSTG